MVNGGSGLFFYCGQDQRGAKLFYFYILIYLHLTYISYTTAAIPIAAVGTVPSLLNDTV